MGRLDQTTTDCHGLLGERVYCPVELLYPETNSEWKHLRMDGWKMSFLLGKPSFRGELLVLGRVIRRYPWRFDLTFW